MRKETELKSYKLEEVQPHELLGNLCFSVVDFETTIHYKKGSVQEPIEVAIVPIVNSAIDNDGIFRTLIKPTCDLSDSLLNLGKVPRQELDTAPVLATIRSEVRRRLLCTVIVHHSANGFDTRICRDFFNINLERIVEINTLRLSRRINPKAGSHSLDNVALRWKVSAKSEKAHRAEYDAIVTAKIFIKMLNWLGKTDSITTFGQLSIFCNGLES